MAPLSVDFQSHPWNVVVSGLVNKPGTFAIEDLLKMFPQEDRIYRLRCVEAWSMVIPWQGFPLASLLKAVEPTSDAKYVAFTTLMDTKQLPAEGNGFYPWPYREGLRLDEAMNDLALLVTGLYGAPLPPQDGAPIRLVVPWKYGFKSIKAIVKIELVADRPQSFWNTIAPYEYGFYANVNPDVPHPRWLAEFRAAHWRTLTPGDVALQWLRRTGRPSLRGHGSESPLLICFVARGAGPRPSAMSTALFARD